MWARFVATVACLSAASCGGEAFTTGDAGMAPDATAASGTDATALDAGDEPDVEAPHFTDGPPLIGPPRSDWCIAPAQAGHTFCEDFDLDPNVNSLFGRWSSFEQMNGNFKFDTVGAPSAPNALEAIGASGAKVIVLKTLPVGTDSPKKIRLEFDLRIDSPGSVGLLSAAGLAAIAFGDSIADGYAALAIGNGPTLAGAWVDSADAGASDAGSFQSSNATAPFPASGVWAGRYAIEIDYVNGGGCVQIYAGVTPLLASCLPLPDRLRHPTTVSAVLGDYAGGVFASTGSIDVEFDDVTFDVL